MAKNEEAKLIPFKDLMKYEGTVFVEFREFPTANCYRDGVSEALWWVERLVKHYDFKIRLFCEGKDWRMWTSEPTKEQMELVVWEE